MKLFVLNGIDFTDKIIVGSYEVNSSEEYDEFQDGNGKYHRNVLRERISGVFEMRFLNTKEYEAFISHWRAYKIAGANHVSLFVNNKNAIMPADVFITISPKMTLKGNGTRAYESFKVNVEES